MIAKLLRVVGIVGTIACVVAFALDPSWPTPDKLLVFLTFVFMIFGQALAMLKRLLPFVVILLAYESFRGLVPSLNTHVHYTAMIHADTALFGTLPTETLQRWLWHGHVQWYDFMFYGAYMLHFILPLTLALLVWKLRVAHYWRVVGTYLAVSFAGFLTFLLYPAAPPWLAMQQGYIPHIERVSSDVFFAMDINSFPSLYSKMSPNPVAAVPSLHAAYATLLVLFVYKLFGKKWALLAAIYPALIYVGTVYMGEHYAFDELLGIAYALVGYAGVALCAEKVWPQIKERFRKAEPVPTEALQD
jgi:hypothetical protein